MKSNRIYYYIFLLILIIITLIYLLLNKAIISNLISSSPSTTTTQQPIDCLGGDINLNTSYLPWDDWDTNCPAIDDHIAGDAAFTITRTRTRTYRKTRLESGEGACPGAAEKYTKQTEKDVQCPRDCKGNWGDWSLCDVGCPGNALDISGTSTTTSSGGQTTQTQTFKISTSRLGTGAACATRDGATITQDCSANLECDVDCLGNWSEWTRCDAAPCKDASAADVVSINHGRYTRNLLDFKGPFHRGAECPAIDVSLCSNICPVDCSGGDISSNDSYSSWAFLSDASTCPPADNKTASDRAFTISRTQNRTYKIRTREALNGGACPGDDVANTRRTIDYQCPRDCSGGDISSNDSYTDWNNWDTTCPAADSNIASDNAFIISRTRYRTYKITRKASNRGTCPGDLSSNTVQYQPIVDCPRDCSGGVISSNDSYTEWGRWDYVCPAANDKIASDADFRIPRTRYRTYKTRTRQATNGGKCPAEDPSNTRQQESEESGGILQCPRDCDGGDISLNSSYSQWAFVSDASACPARNNFNVDNSTFIIKRTQTRTYNSITREASNGGTCPGELSSNRVRTIDYKCPRDCSGGDISLNTSYLDWEDWDIGGCPSRTDYSIGDNLIRITRTRRRIYLIRGERDEQGDGGTCLGKSSQYTKQEEPYDCPRDCSGGDISLNDSYSVWSSDWVISGSCPSITNYSDSDAAFKVRQFKSRTYRIAPGKSKLGDGVCPGQDISNTITEQPYTCPRDCSGSFIVTTACDAVCPGNAIDISGTSKINSTGAPATETGIFKIHRGRLGTGKACTMNDVDISNTRIITQSCSKICQVDCSGNWDDWTTCDAICKDASDNDVSANILGIRTRTWINRRGPFNGGRTCPTPDVSLCSVTCPIDCLGGNISLNASYSEWENWDRTCPVADSNGNFRISRTRYRTYTSRTRPASNGGKCPGDLSSNTQQYQPIVDCPRDCLGGDISLNTSYTEWGNWDISGNCPAANNKTASDAAFRIPRTRYRTYKTRTREATNGGKCPAEDPSNTKQEGSGVLYQCPRDCFGGDISLNSSFSQWTFVSDVSSCPVRDNFNVANSAFIIKRTQTRTYNTKTREASNGGTCPGELSSNRVRTIDYKCPRDCSGGNISLNSSYSIWGPWDISGCPSRTDYSNGNTSTTGTRTRKRTYLIRGGRDEQGDGGTCLGKSSQNTTQEDKQYVCPRDCSGGDISLNTSYSVWSSDWVISDSCPSINNYIANDAAFTVRQFKSRTYTIAQGQSKLGDGVCPGQDISNTRIEQPYTCPRDCSGSFIVDIPCDAVCPGNAIDISGTSKINSAGRPATETGRFTIHKGRLGTGKACRTRDGNIIDVSGTVTVTQSCSKTCPVDCSGNWNDWSACDAICKDPSLADVVPLISGTRTRTWINRRGPFNGGRICPAPDVSLCNVTCPIDCLGTSYSDWKNWDTTCPAADNKTASDRAFRISRTRYRTYNKTREASYGGKCPGDISSNTQQYQPIVDCPRDCSGGVISSNTSYTEWGDWNNVCPAANDKTASDAAFRISRTRRRIYISKTREASNGGACPGDLSSNTVQNQQNIDCPRDCSGGDISSDRSYSQWTFVSDASTCPVRSDFNVANSAFIIKRTQNRTYRTKTREASNGGTCPGELSSNRVRTIDYKCPRDCSGGNISLNSSYSIWGPWDDSGCPSRTDYSKTDTRTIVTARRKRTYLIRGEREEQGDGVTCLGKSSLYTIQEDQQYVCPRDCSGGDITLNDSYSVWSSDWVISGSCPSVNNYITSDAAFTVRQFKSRTYRTAPGKSKLGDGACPGQDISSNTRIEQPYTCPRDCSSSFIVDIPCDAVCPGNAIDISGTSKINSTGAPATETGRFKIHRGRLGTGKACTTTDGDIIDVSETVVTQSCSKTCPIDCTGKWDDWTACNAICRDASLADAVPTISGTQTRTWINRRGPFNGGRACPVIDVSSCNVTCPIDCLGTSHTDWKNWDTTCPAADNKTASDRAFRISRTRYRTYNKTREASNDGKCPGDLRSNTQQYQPIVDCPRDCSGGVISSKTSYTEWEPWNNVCPAANDKTASDAAFRISRTRRRIYISKTREASNGGACPGDLSSNTVQNQNVFCPRDCSGGDISSDSSFSQWTFVSDASSCPVRSDFNVANSAFIIKRTQNRTYNTRTREASNGGACPGELSSNRVRTINYKCPRDCSGGDITLNDSYTIWGPWDVSGCPSRTDYSKTDTRTIVTSRRKRTYLIRGEREEQGDGVTCLGKSSQYTTQEDRQYVCPRDCSGGDISLNDSYSTWSSDWVISGSCPSINNYIASDAAFTVRQFKSRTYRTAPGKSKLGDGACPGQDISNTRIEQPYTCPRDCSGSFIVDIPCDAVCPGNAIDISGTSKINSAGAPATETGRFAIHRGRLGTGKACRTRDGNIIDVSGTVVTQSCSKICPVDCSGNWDDWTACNAICRDASANDVSANILGIRTRTWINRRGPFNGGRACPVPDVSLCSVTCPIDCLGGNISLNASYSEWKNWDTTCPAADNKTASDRAFRISRTRYRTYTSKTRPASNGGKCPGDLSSNTQQYQPIVDCPRDCSGGDISSNTSYTEWEPWNNVCPAANDKTASDAAFRISRTRRRIYNSKTKEASNGGACPGDLSSNTVQNQQNVFCPRDCSGGDISLNSSYSQWTFVSDASACPGRTTFNVDNSAFIIKRTQTRTYNRTRTASNGGACPGDLSSNRLRTIDYKCPRDCSGGVTSSNSSYSGWENWDISGCPSSTDYSKGDTLTIITRTRKRTYLINGGRDEQGDGGTCLGKSSLYTTQVEQQYVCPRDCSGGDISLNTSYSPWSSDWVINGSCPSINNYIASDAAFTLRQSKNRTYTIAPGKSKLGNGACPGQDMSSNTRIEQPYICPRDCSGSFIVTTSCNAVCPGNAPTDISGISRINSASLPATETGTFTIHRGRLGAGASCRTRDGTIIDVSAGTVTVSQSCSKTCPVDCAGKWETYGDSTCPNGYIKIGDIINGYTCIEPNCPTGYTRWPASNTCLKNCPATYTDLVGQCIRNQYVYSKPSCCFWGYGSCNYCATGETESSCTCTKPQSLITKQSYQLKTTPTLPASEWSACDVSLGTCKAASSDDVVPIIFGRTTRTWKITTKPLNGGRTCPPPDISYNCSVTCPVNCKGSHGNWGNWDTTCPARDNVSVPDAGFTITRNKYRTFNKTRQESGEGKCPEADNANLVQTETGVLCPRNCLGGWGGYGGCSVGCYPADSDNARSTVTGGSKTRYWTMTPGKGPLNGGDACPATTSDTAPCSAEGCNVDCRGGWGACNSYYGLGQRFYSRSRNGENYGNNACPGHNSSEWCNSREFDRNKMFIKSTGAPMDWQVSTSGWKCISTRGSNWDGWGWPSSSWGLVLYERCVLDSDRMRYYMTSDGTILAGPEKHLCLYDDGSRESGFVRPVWGNKNSVSCLKFGSDSWGNIKVKTTSIFDYCLQPLNDQEGNNTPIVLKPCNNANNKTIVY